MNNNQKKAFWLTASIPVGFIIFSIFCFMFPGVMGIVFVGFCGLLILSVFIGCLYAAGRDIYNIILDYYNDKEFRGEEEESN